MTADDEEFDRSRFDDSLELASTQLALQLDLDDEEREAGA
jgi:hypothetical protein